MLMRAAGFSLVELLVAMVAGLLVLAGALSLFTSVLAAGSTNLVLSRLNLEVQAVADVIARDLQKAGYHPNAVTEMALKSPQSTDPAEHYIFAAADDIYSASNLHCIRVKFWDATAPLGKEPKVHLYGYSRRSQKVTLYTKLSANSSDPLKDHCGRGAQLISSAEVHVKQLLFTPIMYADATSIKMTITAAHAQQPQFPITITRYVHLRNGGR
ncbi:PilW family protein [Oceanisphaera pacifica]|uniref:Prepilin-type N-terminal cleavage/methylation domain-containing protein n=1 Tax=Oceanisphaera pacifica TaxID=2818389 RepID=A0ABS3NG90_9GAMM|nr:prepilin-type N-terminal cleavage/methylation domain-containing protein [Oceanisphaera pacifica]MBO1519347.1 prepilin-type N-terminal cleavage/methylation domain-containing protein [Oceanisphaera pacifica]